jgi:Ca2+-binding RTX toxin-like protein
MAIFQGTAADEFIQAFGGVSPSVLVTPAGAVPTAAADIIYAGGGNDRIDGLGGGDLIQAGSGNDTLDGWFQGDTVYGGTGIDLLDLSNTGRDAGEVIDLSTGLIGYGRTRVYQVENVLTGEMPDLVRGSAVANDIDTGFGRDTLLGGGGADTLRGGELDDRLTGGFGRDVLWGGADDDTFVFSDAAASTGRTADVIMGFEGAGAPGGDVINLSGIDANTGLAGNQAFALGTARGAGRLWLENDGASNATILLGNTDADAAAELRIEIRDGSTQARAYVAGDFIL